MYSRAVQSCLKNGRAMDNSDMFIHFVIYGKPKSLHWSCHLKHYIKTSYHILWWSNCTTEAQTTEPKLHIVFCNDPIAQQKHKLPSQNYIFKAWTQNRIAIATHIVHLIYNNDIQYEVWMVEEIMYLNISSYTAASHMPSQLNY